MANISKIQLPDGSVLNIVPSNTTSLYSSSGDDPVNGKAVAKAVGPAIVSIQKTDGEESYTATHADGTTEKFTPLSATSVKLSNHNDSEQTESLVSVEDNSTGPEISFTKKNPSNTAIVKQTNTKYSADSIWHYVIDKVENAVYAFDRLLYDRKKISFGTLNSNDQFVETDSYTFLKNEIQTKHDGNISHMEWLATTNLSGVSLQEITDATEAAQYVGFYGTRKGLDISQGKNRIGQVEFADGTNGSSSAHIRAYNANGSNATISVTVDSSGNKTTAAPTPPNGDHSTQIATTDFVRNFVVVGDKALDNISISANSSVDSTITITKTGYTPIGVIGTLVRNASSSGAQWGNVIVTQAKVNNSTQCGIRLFNKGTSAAKVKATVTVLYVPTAT